MKYLVFFFAFLLVNSIYSQGACVGTYGFSSSSTTTCVYTFTPANQTTPTIASIDWTISSSGQYGVQCDAFTNRSTLTYTFCFSGNHDVTMIVNFTGGGYCTVTNTINVTCSGAIACNPGPQANIPDPVVEITYIAPVNCTTTTDPPYHYCMYTNTGGSNYNVACGWKWAIMVPANQYNCEIFTYWAQWIRAENSGCDSTCAWSLLTPGVPLCIDAKIDQPIWVVADGNHCCVPVGWQRSYIWTPVVNGGLTPIADPVTPLGNCTPYRCPTTGNCTENQTTMNMTPATPLTHCFRGGNVPVNRNKSVFADNANIEQNVIIYNIQGSEIYNGKWKFGDESKLNLNWPDNIGSGLFLIKFQNSDKLEKLFRFN